MRVFLIAFLLAFPLTFPASAQSMCTGRDEILDALSGPKYGESTVAVGLVANGTVLEVLASETGKTWTIIFTNSAGVSCVVAAGTDWETVPVKPKGDPA